MDFDDRAALDLAGPLVQPWAPAGDGDPRAATDTYRAFPGVEERFGLGALAERMLVEVGDGIHISEPLLVELPCNHRGRVEGVYLSHRGLLIQSFCVDEGTSKHPDVRHYMMLLCLDTSRENVFRIGGTAIPCFYDDKVIFVSTWRHLSEANVEDLFGWEGFLHLPPAISIGGDPNRILRVLVKESRILASADPTLLNERRELYYIAHMNKLYCYNVDTKANSIVDVGMKVHHIIPTKGIDSGAKVIFRGKGRYNYVLTQTNSITRLTYGKRWREARGVFLRREDPRDVNGAVFEYATYFLKDSKKVRIEEPIDLRDVYCIIRLFEDMFLLRFCRKWALCRIVVS